MNSKTATSALTLVLVMASAAISASATDREIPITEEVYAKRPFEVRLIDAVRDFVPHVMRAKGTPGLNIAIGYKGRLIWEAGFGYADVAAGRKMTPETVYHSGSLGKTYTATAVMHLVDRGVLSLDDPINKHLPFEVHNPLGDREITIHDLMTHRSGLSTGGARGVWGKPEPLAEALKASYDDDKSPVMARMTPFWIAKVGEKWNYANPGIATLGLIVEIANPDGLSFADYVQKHVMDPLGMTSSQYPPAQHVDYVRPDIWKNMSTGYARMGSAWIPTVPLYFSHYPAGGVLAKPSDHLRLLMAMLAGGTHNGYQVLKPETVEEMLTPQFEHEHSPMFNQGLVWALRDHGKPNFAFSHAGGHMFGWRTDGFGWPGLDVSVMVASNQWSLPDDVQDIAMIPTFVEKWMMQPPPEIDPSPVSDEWAWKVSYVRGVLYAASFKMFVGVPGDMPVDAVEAAIAATRVIPGERTDWNHEAFQAGFDAITRAGFGYVNVTGFWDSDASKVTSAEAVRIMKELGGSFPGSAAMYVPPQAVASQSGK